MLERDKRLKSVGHRSSVNILLSFFWLKKMDFRNILPFLLVCVCITVQLSNCETTSSSCSNSGRADAFIETAAALLDKARESMPLEQNVDCSCPPKPMDCDEVMQCGNNRSGIYQIWPRNRIMTGSIDVYCDLQTLGGGWTVIQRRGDYKRPTDFFMKSWDAYKSGFGDLRKDFWLGNDNIYALTNQKKYYLRIELTDHENNTRYASYDQFWIDNESQHYRLHVFDYSGDAGDSLARNHDSQKFSTIDRDNDNSTKRCAVENKGGWWYNDCHDSNLNGLYHKQEVQSPSGVVWRTWKGIMDSLQNTEMKMRPVDFKLNLLDMDIEPA